MLRRVIIIMIIDTNPQTDKENYIDFRLRLLGEPGHYHFHPVQHLHPGFADVFFYKCQIYLFLGEREDICQLEDHFVKQ